ncbi:MAG: hypothetical protein A3E07_00180 [Candidatus Wildermuthbacteria bacterium RIFCSPHIGHO2_12_FULL_45_9]|uniref:Uncharacterized protein n=1 Tax=Candidatus Wildermuthbacteria bacterium RIFCSPHIGHO2_02_FULL_45_25 TaxID=1802450 RepID=A0A1G2QZ34_9BACT|nr:MAG: hypothetical protein A2748_02120 [Candidatus Wildermuthbacteria bacterium RIFCSPHIGHO2_01_FULL_45_20]OHA65717.1 MAG: hypothetical protein A3C04_02265 [Candidatus Wildermuthbacteria bacterium RIFCSPHIGHO2_02_FULL_45_25]OHA70676.1 MAG: hypothetical protein A3E07_00180 [Candidatus Wildermuthbacteria bacterium RIFCSPHIGHO2_12_FULL_45_9]
MTQYRVPWLDIEPPYKSFYKTLAEAMLKVLLQAKRTKNIAEPDIRTLNSFNKFLRDTQKGITKAISPNSGPFEGNELVASRTMTSILLCHPGGEGNIQTLVSRLQKTVQTLMERKLPDDAEMNFLETFLWMFSRNV